MSSIKTLSSATLLLSLLAAGGCGSASSVHTLSSRHFVRVPTSSWRPGQLVATAFLTGKLVGGAIRPGEYCVWIENKSGSRVPIVWPAGFSARLHPLEVLNAAGVAFAHGGEKVGLVGGIGPAHRQSCLLGKDTAFYVNSELPVSRSR